MSGDAARTLLVTLVVVSFSLGGVGVAGATDATTNQSDAAITGGAVLPGSVTPGTTVSDQRVSVRLANLSADGRPDILSLVVPDALAGNLTVRGATATGNVSVVGATLVDGPDDDGNRDTVAVRTNASAGESVDTTLDVTLDVTYPDRNATYAVDAVLLDSRSGVSTANDVATVVVGSGAEQQAANADTDSPTSQDVDVTLSNPEDVQKAKVKAKSKVKNATLAPISRTGCLGPTNRTPFVYNQDVDVHVNNATGDIGKLKVKVKSKVKKIDFADAPRVRVNATNATCPNGSAGAGPTAGSGDDGSVGVNGLLGWGSRSTVAGTGTSTPGGSSGVGTSILGGGVGALAVGLFRSLV
ncbi:hypothetical protein [Halospeciosus flavus]|uniref:Uncharacterized protein n=1 Tax=Halospeciosus flavus TaxID=3032283 RepID=A0ABD5Z0J5_9EURY|nr:hypothetical protein [Halospeciosus flavus]